MTLWAAFGSYDWDSLLTRSLDHYEPGAFDVSSSTPRETLVAEIARELARRGTTDHPFRVESAWWRREQRLLYAGAGDRAA